MPITKEQLEERRADLLAKRAALAKHMDQCQADLSAFNGAIEVCDELLKAADEIPSDPTAAPKG